MTVPNLDTMTADELLTFWMTHQQGRRAHHLFPDGGPGTRIATRQLANYASNKATAIRCRLTGNIDVALGYEQIADRIYKELPAWARW
jgi:hypothetical protein